MLEVRKENQKEAVGVKGSRVVWKEKFEVRRQSFRQQSSSMAGKREAGLRHADGKQSRGGRSDDKVYTSPHSHLRAPESELLSLRGVRESVA